jgi:hypothetical protein
MKKVSILFVTTLMSTFFTSCGPSETERKAEEEKVKHEADSIKASIKADIASEMDSLKSENKNSDSLVKEEKTKTK